MKKTIGIIGSLILTVFVGVFIASMTRKALLRKETAARESTPIAETSVTKTPDRPKPLFYTSVGGSQPKTELTAQSAKISTRYTIEVATLTSQADAEALILRLKAKGVDGFYTPTRRGGQVFYHVRLGLFASAEDAQQSLKKIASRSGFNGRIQKLN